MSAAIRPSLKGKTVLLPCALCHGGSSHSRVWRVDADENGGEFVGSADMSYCLKANRSPLAEDEPSQGDRIAGYVFGVVISHDGDTIRVNMPDGDSIRVGVQAVAFVNRVTSSWVATGEISNTMTDAERLSRALDGEFCGDVGKIGSLLASEVKRLKSLALCDTINVRFAMVHHRLWEEFGSRDRCPSDLVDSLAMRLCDERGRVDRLKQDNASLAASNGRLSAENERLKEQNEFLFYACKSTVEACPCDKGIDRDGRSCLRCESCRIAVAWDAIDREANKT